MILFVTSSPVGTYRSNEPVDYSGFNPANGMVNELQRFWKENSRCLLISAFPDEYALNDIMRRDFETIVKDTGLSAACMDLCDKRNGEMMANALGSYDFVILGGGHVPTENAFFAQIGLREHFRDFHGIAMGISAGSMNCANLVYAQPELSGEATDPSYRKFIPGLGLTEYNILPHYHAVKNDLVDGLRLMEDITYPDSVGRVFYAIPDGSYLLQTDSDAAIHGEAYRIRDGQIKKISENGSVYVLKLFSE